MKKRKIYLIVFLLVSMLAGMVSGCSSTDGRVEKNAGKIYLYGERHGIESILEAEFDLWYDYYHNDGMRHLFIESSYYAGELLNLWMKSEDDQILDQLFIEQAGTLGSTPYNKEFYKKIKKECPDTIFHGTDIGHQYDSTGHRYLQYLKEEGKEDSEQYQLAEEAIAQGRYYYTHEDEVYREDKMVENFTREFDSLKSESVMGIYGSAHTDPEAFNYTGQVDCMAKQIKQRYGDILYSEDLTTTVEIEPEKVEVLEIEGKEYKASYFGAENVTGMVDGFTQLEFWRIENAYDDFKHESYIRDSLPSYNYPTAIKIGDVWLVEATKTDGSILKLYYRCDKNIWITKGFRIDET